MIILKKKEEEKERKKTYEGRRRQMGNVLTPEELPLMGSTVEERDMIV